MTAKVNINTINLWNANDDILVSAAEKIELNPEYVVRIAALESGFNPAARPIATRDPSKNTVKQFDGELAISSAYGYGQFLDDTWLGTLKEHGKDYGLENAEEFTLKEANQVFIRSDVKLQAAMLAELTMNNMTFINDKMIGTGKNRSADISDIYVMHNLGTGRGKVFLEQLEKNPGKLVSEVLTNTEIGNNPALYSDGSITLTQAHENIKQHVNGAEIYVKAMRSELPLEIPENVVPLKLGDEGKAVRDYQEQLVKVGYQVDVTGVFDEKTLGATQQLQKDCYLSSTKGALGFETYAALNATISERPYQLSQIIPERYAEITALNEKYQTTTDVNERKQLEVDLSAKRLDVSKLEFERSSLLEEQSAKLQNQKTELTHQFDANAAKISALGNIQQQLDQVDSSQSNAYASIQHDFNQTGISLLTPAQERVANKETLDLTNKADITALQNLLSEEGLLKATARGAFGDQTKTALREALGKEADYAFDVSTA